jgi:transcriptional regulator GlxA family with amidase domain
LRVLAHFDFATAPPIDLLVIPGGFGTRQLLDDLEVRQWIQKASKKARLTTSVCTGALLLAKAGLLSGRRATTHWGAHDLLASIDSTIVVERHLRVVVDAIVTSAGVAAGIDMALAVVETLHGKAVADEAAGYMEFPRHVLP